MDKLLLDNIMAMRGDISRINEIVRRHDQETFPEIQGSLKRIESKHNQDFLQYIASKEELSSRIEPLERDLEERQEIKGEKDELIMEGKKGFISNAVSAVIGGVVALIGYLLAKSGLHIN